MSSFMELTREWAASLHIPNILQGLTAGVRITLVPVFARQLGSSDSAIGLIVGSAGLVKFLLDIPFGFATAVYGTRTIMTVGMIINFLGSCIAAIAITPSYLAIASMLWGTGIGAFFVARHVFIAKAVPRNIRGRLMSMIGGAVRWSSFLGPTLAGVTMDTIGMRATAFSLAPLCIICAYLVATNKEIQEVDAQRRQGEEGKVDLSEELHDMLVAFRKYWDVVLRIGVYSFIIICLRQNRRLLLALSAMNMGLSATMVGFVLGVSFIVDASLFFLGGYVMDKFGRKAAAIPTTVNLGIAFFLLSFSNNTASLIAISIFFGLADSLGAGILMTLTADHSPPSGGAPFMGLMRTMQDSGQMIGPVICGYILQHFGFSFICYVMGILGFLNGLWAYFMIPEKSSSQLEEEEEEEEAAMRASDVVIVSDDATKELNTSTDIIAEDKRYDPLEHGSSEDISFLEIESISA